MLGIEAKGLRARKQRNSPGIHSSKKSPLLLSPGHGLSDGWDLAGETIVLLIATHSEVEPTQAGWRGVLLWVLIGDHVDCTVAE
jgi:hypothetical protein